MVCSCFGEKRHTQVIDVLDGMCLCGNALVIMHAYISYMFASMIDARKV